MAKFRFVGMQFVLTPDQQKPVFVEPDVGDGLIKISVSPEWSKMHPMLANKALNDELKKLGLEEDN